VVSERNGAWGYAIPVPGPGTVNQDGFARVASVSCTAPGTCSAGGYYVDKGARTQAFVVDEWHGWWGKAMEVPGVAALSVGGSSEITSLSCSSPGYCGAGGAYGNSTGEGVFVVSQEHGIWGRAQPIALPAAGQNGLSSLSCGAAGDCVAGGVDEGEGCCFGHGSVVTEVNGTWHAAQQDSGLAPLGAATDFVDSVSCGSASRCTAGGSYYTNPGPAGSPGVAFAVGEKNGVWGSAHAFATQDCGPPAHLPDPPLVLLPGGTPRAGVSAMGDAAHRRGLRLASASATSPPPTWSRPSTGPALAGNSIGRVIESLLRNDLIICDELGFAPLDDTGAQLLFWFVAAAYERRSLGIGSHWPIESWGRFLPEHTTAVSMLDRLLHHCHVVVTCGAQSCS
jgi:IstB-like ATP binding protein